jgi:FMN phosphatase YigB (HAD superfamily)
VHRIEWIFLDLGGVLYGLDYRGVLRRFCRRCSKRREELENLLYDMDLYRSFESGSISSREFHRTVIDRLKCRLEFEEFSSIWNSLLVKRKSMFRLAHGLKERVGLLFLSNTNEINASFIDPDIREITDKIVYSHVVGFMKPDPRIFEEALRLSGAAPERTLFVDDRKENLEGAAMLGIGTHHFVNRRSLLRALKAYELTCLRGGCATSVGIHDRLPD